MLSPYPPPVLTEEHPTGASSGDVLSIAARHIPSTYIALRYSLRYHRSSKEVRMRLREIRISRGISQNYLEEMSGVKQANISSIESGRCGASLDTLRRLASALSCTLDELAADATGGPEVGR